MVAIKSTAMKEIPKYCEECCWYELRPHPARGWTELCNLMMQCMDDSESEEWIYDGNGRPKACPLIEIKPISYSECSNAMLQMWLDNILTDGEYNQIMDKLNEFNRKDERTMDDCISRSAVLDILYLDPGIDVFRERMIKSLPSAQPEIIRCKDCKHIVEHKGYGDLGESAYTCEGNMSGWVLPDSYCSYAERKTDD